MNQIFTLWITIFLTFIISKNIQMNPNNILNGTTIITSITQDKIIIAADSKQTWGEDYSREAPLKCKIRHIGNLFFAAEGITQMFKPNIDFLEIIENLDLKKALTFENKIDYIALKLREPVQEFAQNYQKFNPIAFDSILNKTLFSISFSQFENEKPCSSALYWEIKSTATGWEIVPGRATSEQIPRYMIQGQKDAIDYYYENNINFKNKIYDEKGLNELIEIQIKASPQKVGLPIDIVVINSQGFQWIQKKEECD